MYEITLQMRMSDQKNESSGREYRNSPKLGAQQIKSSLTMEVSNYSRECHCQEVDEYFTLITYVITFVFALVLLLRALQAG